MRRFTGDTIVGGQYTEAELAVCRQLGLVNAFRESPMDVAAELEAQAPDGWRVTWGERIDLPLTAADLPLTVPAHANAITEPILLGQARVRTGDPPYSIWVYRVNRRGFYISGGNGSYVELDDDRYADTVHGETSEDGMDAGAALNMLCELDGVDWVSEAEWQEFSHYDNEIMPISQYVGQ